MKTYANATKNSSLKKQLDKASPGSSKQFQTKPDTRIATLDTIANSPAHTVTQKVLKREENESVQAKGNKTGLPDNLKTGIENLSGHSMDDVKVHYNSSKPKDLGAHAYAQGTDIHLGSGQEKHLPHEAWHVVQQKQGRVKPTLQMKGRVNVNDDVALEKEADVMGEKTILTPKNKKSFFTTATNTFKNPVTQMVLNFNSPIKAEEVKEVKQAGGKLVFILTGKKGKKADKVIVKIEPVMGGESKGQMKTRNNIVQGFAEAILANVPGSSQLTEQDKHEILKLNGLGGSLDLLKRILSDTNYMANALVLKKEHMDVGKNLGEIIQDDDNANARNIIVKKVRNVKGLLLRSQKILLNASIVKSLGRMAAFDLFIGNYDRFQPDAEGTNLENIDFTQSEKEVLSLDQLDPNSPIVKNTGEINQWEGEEIMNNKGTMHLWGNNVYNHLFDKAKIPDSMFDSKLSLGFISGMDEAVAIIKSRKGLMKYLSLNQASWSSDENREIASALLSRINLIK